MTKKLKQSHFILYLQNYPLKFCFESYVLPLPQKLLQEQGSEGENTQRSLRVNAVE